MIYCDDCGCEIIGKPISLKYDLALDADDGYGDYIEYLVCRDCAGLDVVDSAASVKVASETESTPATPQVM